MYYKQLSITKKELIKKHPIESKEYVGYFRSYVNGAFGENPPYQIKNSVKKFNTEWDRIIGSKSNVQNYRKSMIKWNYEIPKRKYWNTEKKKEKKIEIFRNNNLNDKN